MGVRIGYKASAEQFDPPTLLEYTRQAEAAGLEIRRFELPNLSALNFVVVGLLGEGVAASTRPDPQAKGLGEYLRSRTAEIPASLLGRGGP